MEIGDIVLVKTYKWRLGRVKELPIRYGSVFKVSVSKATYTKQYYSSIRELNNGDDLHIAMKFKLDGLDDFEKELYKELKLKFYLEAI